MSLRAASCLLLGASAFVSSLPVSEKRTVSSLNQPAFQEAQQRDATATRAFSSVPIKTSSGQCLFVDELSGDFRANLTPIQVAACDGSTGQSWDIITKGKHNDQAGDVLVVNTLTQACLNFDPRRAAGNQVLMFSCGGRADGSGAVADSQLFPFKGGAGPQALSPSSAAGTCLTVTSGNVLDQAACNTGDANQSFSFGDGSASPAPASSAPASSAPASPASSTASSPSSCPSDTETPESNSAPAADPSTSTSDEVSVARAGGVLNPSAAAEANPRDDTATRAFSSVSLKSAAGQCLSINATAGDFRENLIPIAVQGCDGSAGQKFDIITAGKHNNLPGSALIVSTLTQGCLNFDPRRAAGDTVIMFSCGGRADGGGAVTNSQLFPFTAGEKSLALAPENGNNATCLVAKGALLDQAACSGDASQLFSIV